MNDDERDALLIRTSTNVEWLMKMFSTHMKHHWVFTATVMGTILTIIGGVIISLVR